MNTLHQAIVFSTLLLSQSVLGEFAAETHAGHGGFGFHGGRGGGFRRGHGGFGRFGPTGPPFGVPYPVPAPVPFPIVAPFPAVASVPAAFGVSPGSSISSFDTYGPDSLIIGDYSGFGYPSSMGVGPVYPRATGGYARRNVFVNGRNTDVAPVMNAAGSSAGVSVSASANIQPAMAGSQPQVYASQAPFVQSAVASGRRFDQGTAGLGIDIDGQAGSGMMPQQGMPSQPMPMQPQQPMPMPPTDSGSGSGRNLVVKGFSKKTESYDEQKSGSKVTTKDYGKEVHSN